MKKRIDELESYIWALSKCFILHSVNVGKYVQMMADELCRLMNTKNSSLSHEEYKLTQTHTVIVDLADCFDVMTEEKPYKEKMSEEDAPEKIQRQRCALVTDMECKQKTVDCI